MSDLYELVEPDPKLSGDEKETMISMYGTEKTYTIHSGKPTVVRSLLQHDHFDLRSARVRYPDDDVERGSAGSTLSQTTNDDAERGSAGSTSTAFNREQCEDAEAIYAVTGEMPVGTLTVKSKPRTNNHQSSIVSHETVSADAFTGGEK